MNGNAFVQARLPTRPKAELLPDGNRNLYNREVQRLWAAILLSVTGFLPVTGALSNISAHAASLPACCRAHGKHNCARQTLTNGAASLPIEPAISSICDQYPSPPPANLAVAKLSTFPPKGSEAFHPVIVSHRATQLEREPRLNSWFERSHWKRGPPCFFS